ncbi:hypothetical protein AX16_007927 [Volvariella volvacea WC 439]|nr:hypothetical protein AX16_007927 [Volvariella volvacea WC 439]
MFLAGLFLTAFARSLASPVPITVPGSTTPSPVCVVAAVITASRCDPTQTRTLFDILYSCIGVILLCTYISMHHNIPDQDDSWAKVTWLKLRTTLYALIVPELVMMWAIRQWIMARNIARQNSDRGWTKTHGFFVQMGGLVQKESGGEVGYRVVCDPKKLTGMKIPCIPEKEIQDHGKGDLLAKAIVVIQTTWFVAQCIARRVQGLALTEIELVTLAFATLNVVTYGLWWNKPLNVGYPIYFDANGNRVDGPLADNDGPQIRVQEGAWYEKLWGDMKDYVAGCGEVWHRMKESWQASLRQQGVMKAIWEKVIMLPFSAVFAPLFDMITHLKAENRPTSVHPFYAASPSDSDHMFAIVIGSVIGILFGAIHLIGWNFQFPTIIELWLWRVSALVLTIIPFLFTISLSAINKNEALFVLFSGSAPPLYFSARIVLLFLAFFTLRSLPDSAYQNVTWTEFIPHI